MKTFYRYAAVAAVSLFCLSACSSDDTEEQPGSAMIGQPQVTVRDVTTNGFTLRWNKVDDADTYNFTLNGGEASSTTACEVTFSDLEREKEYVVAVRACPFDAARYQASSYTYVHVITDEIERLPSPKITLGSSYSTRTIISWSDVPEAEAYEFTIAGQTFTTPLRQASFTSLGRDETYTFSLRALTGDASRFTDSEPAELQFTTSSDDVPAILIAPTEVISDAVAYDIYATSDVTYFYDVVPAATFVKFAPSDVVLAYQEYAISYAQELSENKGVDFTLAMASLLKAGTQSLILKGLYPEMSYVVFAFGMDLQGRITTDLSYTTFKTTADGYSDGPNFGGANWFRQSFYISNAYAAMGYDWTNSVFTYWEGADVTKVRYRTLATSTFRQLFPDVNDTESIKLFLKDDNYAYQLADNLLPTVNSSTGYTSITGASMGISYTTAALATSSSGEETLCVNSVTTKTDPTSRAWFLARAIKNANYGPTHNTVAGAMTGVDVATCRYAFFEAAALTGIPTSLYPQVVEQYGNNIPSQYIPSINGNGFALVFGESAGIEPETEYVFLSTAVNLVGDKLTKWASVTTDAAPAAGGNSAARKTRAAQPAPLGQSPAGTVVPDLDRFIYPMEAIALPADAVAEGDHWTIIHNKQILK